LYKIQTLSISLLVPISITMWSVKLNGRQATLFYKIVQ
jgi:hypothetical protein